MRYLVILLLTLGTLFGLQMVALRLSGGRTIKSESNFFSSLGRAQAGAVGNPEIMLLGSSITGRLPDRAQGYAGIANLGCDGGSAIDALRAIDRQILPSAPTLVIEANTLQHALSHPNSEVGLAMSKPWFQVGLRFPCLAAYARPSAFIYSSLLGGRAIAAGEKGEATDLGVTSEPAPVTKEGREIALASQQQLVDEIAGILDRLSKKEVRPVFVWLPPGRPQDVSVPEWIMALAAASDADWWDLGNQAQPERVTLTDGVHMDAASAARTVRTLSGVLYP